MTTVTLYPAHVAAATPARRERYVDFLRVFSLAVVMFGHWLMAAVQWRDGHLVAAVDVARWTFGVPLIGWANLGLVWLFAHQLGVAWREGTFALWSRRRLAVLAAAGLGALLVLTQLTGYPHSMVGGVGEVRSNM